MRCWVTRNVDLTVSQRNLPFFIPLYLGQHLAQSPPFHRQSRETPETHQSIEQPKTINLIIIIKCRRECQLGIVVSLFICFVEKLSTLKKSWRRKVLLLKLRSVDWMEYLVSARQKYSHTWAGIPWKRKSLLGDDVWCVQWEQHPRLVHPACRLLNVGALRDFGLIPTHTLSFYRFLSFRFSFGSEIQLAEASICLESFWGGREFNPLHVNGSFKVFCSWGDFEGHYFSFYFSFLSDQDLT